MPVTVSEPPPLKMALIQPLSPAGGGGLNPAQLEAGGTDHSHQTFRLLMATAPAANLWHFNSRSYYDRRNDIIANQIQTMSMSIGNFSGETDDDMRFMDDMAYRWPYPVFCNPASNYGYNLVSNWLCYNAINVGNVRHTNQTHWELAGCTQTTNPPALYGQSTQYPPINDRELPMLVAPGISSDINNLNEKESCTGSTGWCGTSWSAPIVNGLAADVIAADSRMSGWPEKVRAALLLTAQNVDGGYWGEKNAGWIIDGRDGAGVVHGANAVAFAKGHTSVGRDGTPAVDGLDANALAASDFNDPNPVIYKIKIPNPKPSGKHLRVVLTWDSNPTPVGSATSENQVSDLDLVVSGGVSSHSWNSNVEMVDFDNFDFSPGQTIDASIYKQVNRIPATSRAQFFYYAIGWTWVQDHAP